MISVLSTTNGCMSFVLSSCRGFQARDADGRLRGLFAEKQAAVEAITDLNSTGD
jgi:hypothetical protein